MRIQGVDQPLFTILIKISKVHLTEHFHLSLKSHPTYARIFRSDEVENMEIKKLFCDSCRSSSWVKKSFLVQFDDQTRVKNKSFIIIAST